MPPTNPNSPTGIRKYIDEQIDEVLSQIGGGDGGTDIGFLDGVLYTRAAMTEEEANAAEDMLRFEYDGNRTGYHNEYGEVRGRAAKTSTVAARFARRSDLSTANIFEVTTQGNVLLAGFSAAGLLVGPGVVPGVWTACTFETGAANAGGTYPNLSVRYEPTTKSVRLKGRIAISGAGFSSGVTCAHLPAGFFPIETYSDIVRTSSAGALLTVNTDGTIQVGAALTAGQFVACDGKGWSLT